jgi:hypothetical protein
MRQNDFDVPTEYPKSFKHLAEEEEVAEPSSFSGSSTAQKLSRLSSESKSSPPLPQEPVGILEIVAKFVHGIGPYHKAIQSRHSKDFRDGE